MATFNESDHPRAPDGKFGAGSGGAGSGGGGATPRLSAAQKSYISSYTGDDFLAINAELRAGGAGDSPPVKAIDAALAKSTLPKGTVLYRGMSREAAKKFIGGSEIKAGDVLTDKAFMSASSSKDFASSFYGLGGVVFEIETGDDQEGLDVSALTRNPAEKEILLPRNTRLHVKSIVAPKQVGNAVIVRVSTGASAKHDAQGGSFSLNEPDAPAPAAAKHEAHDIVLDADKLDAMLRIVDGMSYRADREFHEPDHPRDENGKFSEGGGGTSSRSNLQETRTENGKRVQANGAPLPEHIQKLKLPPAWTDVKYSETPDADLLAVGKDSKGRVQSVYSSAFSATQAAAKFERIHELSQKFGYISEQNAEAQRSSVPRTKDSADCLDLIMKMGVRPGSETDTGAKVKAYGATTLEGRHVVVDGDSVSLRFVGKKGVSLDLPVHDRALAGMLRQRARAAGNDGKLFPATNDKALLDHVHSLDGGGFKTKDFRTHLATSAAYELVESLPKPTSMSEYKRSVMEVAKRVSQKLGNTPVIALQSYISPTVFAEWKIAA